VDCGLERFRRLNLCGAGARAWTRRVFRRFARRVYSPTLFGNCAARRLALASFVSELMVHAGALCLTRRCILNERDLLRLTVGDRQA
jgi:hypothetical protein